MIEVIFTIDYELYGDGTGSLVRHILEPAKAISDTFMDNECPLVFFIEAAELEVIEKSRSFPEIRKIKDQIKSFHAQGYEIGLHLHPQWYNAELTHDGWSLKYDFYNICGYPEQVIKDVISRGASYLEGIVGDTKFSPISYRGGNWLLQPTENIAKVLVNQGIVVDSSVFKGGYQHLHGLDYRPSLKNGYYWKFSNDVNVPDPQGLLLELPIYTQMVPFWKMATAKRMSLQTKGVPAGKKRSRNLMRLIDFCRLRYPLKLDFCRMTLHELTNMFEYIIAEDKRVPDTYKPIVAIGHTKDLVDLETIKSLLKYLKDKEIPVSTFTDVYPKCI